MQSSVGWLAAQNNGPAGHEGGDGEEQLLSDEDLVDTVVSLLTCSEMTV